MDDHKKAAAPPSVVQEGSKQVRADAQKTPWGPIETIFISLGVFGITQIVAGVVISIVLGFLSQQKLMLSDTISQFLIVVFAESLLIASIILYVRLRRGNVGMVGLRLPKINDVGWALIGFGIYFFVYIAIAGALASIIPQLDLDQEQDVGFNDVQGSTELILTFISLVVIVPIAEELLFRGFLYSGLRRRLSFIPAVLAASLIFAAGHLPTGVGGLLWIGALDTFILSALLCGLREKTGRIWAGVLVHAIKNAIAFLSIYIFVA